MTKLDNIARRAMARMDELGDDAIQAMRNTPEARARQVENAAKARAAEAKREAARLVRKDAAVAANGFVVGQAVQSKRRMGADFMISTVVAVSGANITLDNGRTFAASFFVAA